MKSLNKSAWERERRAVRRSFYLDLTETAGKRHYYFYKDGKATPHDSIGMLEVRQQGSGTIRFSAYRGVGSFGHHRPLHSTLPG